MSSALPPHFIANDLALDFVNSTSGMGKDAHDFLADDQGVVDWLKAAGVLPAAFGQPPAGLATLARALRSDAKELISAARAGRPGDITTAHQILDAGQPAKRLEWDDAKAGFVLVERPRDGSAASLLQPVAAALAVLLSDGDLRQVRQCEAHDCTLVFLDATKSRRRRWCSMAVCGNRMKVAAFRSRIESTPQ